MKKITSIQFVNYKAFFGDGEQNKVNIKDGKNVLIYGENGSGKSSIYEGVKQFFNSSDNTQPVIPSRHLKVPATEILNQGTAEEVQIVNEVAVKVTFEENGNFEEKIFGVPYENVKSTRYISNANLLNSFLSYRELLRTYLMEDLKDKSEFTSKFAFLLIETILAQNKNSGTQTSYISYWEHLHRPRGRYKEEHFNRFKNGLVKDIKDINLILNEILNYFEPELKVQLVLTEAYIEYYHSPKVDRLGHYPICKIDLKIELFGENVENDEENHLTVLNEARLSAIAISLYFASIINAPQVGFDYKILFLDDIFIGLDMSNRIPLLKILTEFKKPIVAQTFDEATGEIVEGVQLINGIKQFEPQPFFDSYQVFITTYDLYWFNIAKEWFLSKRNQNWTFIEMFVDDMSQTFNVPLILPYKSKYATAETYLAKKDYRACASYLRALCEEELNRILPNKYKLIQDRDDNGNLITKNGGLNDWLVGFEQFCLNEEIDFEPYRNIKIYKNHILNTLSHNDISSPIYKKELLDTLSSIKQLENISVRKVQDKIQNFGFSIPDDAGNNVNVRIRKRDSILIIDENGNYKLSNDNKCELESSECDGIIITNNQEFLSIKELYNSIILQYNITAENDLISLLFERVRGTSVPRNILELI